MLNPLQTYKMHFFLQIFNAIMAREICSAKKNEERTKRNETNERNEIIYLQTE